jgi:hypothetical protein
MSKILQKKKQKDLRKENLFALNPKRVTKDLETGHTSAVICRFD